jgi:hypothetical protein
MFWTVRNDTAGRSERSEIGPKKSIVEFVAELAADQFDITGITKSLQDTMNELQEKYKAREEQYRTATTQLRDNYELIMEEAKKNAEAMVAAATVEGDAIVAAAKEETSAWTTEKERLAHVQSFKSQVKVDVGGSKFTTSLTTLQRFPETMIGAMFSGRHALPLDDGGYFFIDRDGTHFRHILNFLRQPEGFSVDLPAAQLKELKKECAYYGLLEVMFPPRVTYFPAPSIVPAAQVHAVATNGIRVVVTQDKDGLWRGDGVLLQVCRACCTAQMPPPPVGYARLVVVCIKNFTTTPHVRVLADAQPKPAMCSQCRAEFGSIFAINR